MKTSRLHLFSPAKINLFLHITGRRADGYHDLQSVFRALDFGDEMDFVLDDRQTGELIRLTGAQGLTDNPKDNLIIKAAYALKAQYPHLAHPTAIHLNKRIPTGAGLGGGSSNCASTLIALNKLWKLNLPLQKLLDIGAKLGADVPFFIFAHHHKTDAQALGIGDKLSTLKLPDCRYLLLLPQEHTATSLFFKDPDLKKDCPYQANIDQRLIEFDGKLSANFSNVFEPIALKRSAKVTQALDFLKSLENETQTSARLSGTGSTVFLPITSNIDQKTLQDWQNAAPCPSILAKNLY